MMGSPLKKITNAVGKVVGGVLGTSASTPKVETVDAAAEQEAAENEAQATANASAAALKKKRAQNSLLSSGNSSASDTVSSVLAKGKNTFGE